MPPPKGLISFRNFHFSHDCHICRAPELSTPGMGWG